MTTRLECDFRHGLCEPTVTETPAGPVLALVHGMDSVTVAMSEHSLRALWLAAAAAVARGRQ